jgi:DNA (cytosine-5)-methyltransferase 1
LKILDTFSGAGGCSEGYRRAGFEPYGIDIKNQPHYPFPFLKMDALEALDRLIKGESLTFSNSETLYETLYLKDFAAIHASPPCKADNQAVLCRPKSENARAKYQRLIVPTRERLLSAGKPYVIENVPLARNQLKNPIMLCGTMFGLKVRRHRYFETSFELLFMPAGCACSGSAGYTAVSHGFSSFENGAKLISVAGHNFAVEDARIAMGISWTGQSGLSQAIPPVYTEFIGKYLMQECLKDKVNA